MSPALANNALHSWQEQPPLDLAVIGAGIAGLSAAHTASRLGWRVGILEASRHVGGKMRSERKDGYLVEHGPNSFMGSAEPLWQLIEDLDLEGEVIKARAPAHRFVYRDRQARRLPMDPGTLFGGDYMSLAGKLRLMAEPFVLGDAQPDDTVWTFACRRLGEEAARYLVAPFVSGVYAGDARQLGARDAFPKLWQWEHDAGSVVLGAVLGMGDRPPSEKPKRRGMFSFRDGLGTLPRAIAAALPDGAVQLGAPVERLERSADGLWRLWLHHAVADGLPPIRAKRVIVATPAKVAADLLGPLCAEAAALLDDVQCVRVAVVHVGGVDPDGRAPRGFGVLMPPGEGLRTLGILLPSSVFEGRAPAGHWLHTGFIGGANDPEAVDLPDDTLVSLVMRAQGHAFGALGATGLEPGFATVIRWRDAIPQYRVGHRDAMLKASAAVEAACRGLVLAGSYASGISMADSAASGMAAVETLVAGS